MKIIYLPNQTIEEILKTNKKLKISFMGSFKTKLYTIYKKRIYHVKLYFNNGIFKIKNNRLICKGMPFSRHISKVTTIEDMNGNLLFQR